MGKSNIFTPEWNMAKLLAMKFGPEITRKIIAALDAKIPNAKCPLCGTDKWETSPGLVFIPLQDELGSWNFAGPVYACIAITCKNCGNTHTINLGILEKGILDTLSSTIPPPPEK